MRGLTLTQPWATLMAIGAKRIETRSWSTKYRGLLAIHAAKSWPRDCQKQVFEWPFSEVLIKYFKGKAYEPNFWTALAMQLLPRGEIVATANLINCVATGCAEIPALIHPPAGSANEYEFYFGDYSHGRCAWILSDVRALKSPIPCQGALGLWNVPADIAARVKEESLK